MAKSFLEQEWSKILQLQSFLHRHQYFSKDCLPGVADALMFQIFDREFPNREKYPFIYYWYINVKQFSPEAISCWSLRSDKDLEFLSILNRYQQHQNRGSNLVQYSKSETDSCEPFSPSKIIPECLYVFNIKMLASCQREMAQLKKTIQKQNLQEIECLGQTLKIKIKCDKIKIQLMISEVKSLLKGKFSGFEVVSQGKRKLARAKTIKY